MQMYTSKERPVVGFPAPPVTMLRGKRLPELAKIAVACGVPVNPMSNLLARLTAGLTAAHAAQVVTIVARNKAAVAAKKATEAARLAASKPVPDQVEADIKAMGLSAHEAQQVRAMVAPPATAKTTPKAPNTTPIPVKPAVVAVVAPVVTPPVVAEPAELPDSAIEPLNGADVAVLDELQDAKAQWAAWTSHADLLETESTRLLSLLAHADDVIADLKGRLALRDDHVADLLRRVNDVTPASGANEDVTVRLGRDGRWRSVLTGRFAKAKPRS